MVHVLCGFVILLQILQLTTLDAHSEGLVQTLMPSFQDMAVFFQDTYAEKMSGDWDNKKKAFVVPGYINGYGATFTH